MTGQNDGYFAIELGGAFYEFGMGGEDDEVTRAKELMDEIERRVVGLRDKMWGLPPEVQAKIDRLEAENARLKANLSEVARELIRIASKGRD